MQLTVLYQRGSSLSIFILARAVERSSKKIIWWSLNALLHSLFLIILICRFFCEGHERANKWTDNYSYKSMISCRSKGPPASTVRYTYIHQSALPHVPFLSWQYHCHFHFDQHCFTSSTTINVIENVGNSLQHPNQCSIDLILLMPLMLGKMATTNTLSSKTPGSDICTWTLYYKFIQWLQYSHPAPYAEDRLFDSIILYSIHSFIYKDAFLHTVFRSFPVRNSTDCNVIHKKLIVLEWYSTHLYSHLCVFLFREI